MSAPTRAAEVENAVLRHLASWGLGGRSRVGVDLPPSLDESRLAHLIRHHRVTGVALDALDDGAIRSPSGDLRRRIERDHVALLGQTMLAEADLVTVVREFSANGIAHRVLKGLATAHLDHTDPALRMTSDADVLVPPGQLARATRAIDALIDHSATVPDRRAEFVERYGKDRTLRLRSGGWLDLHRLIAPAYWGFSLDHDRLFEQSESFTLAGTQMHALARHDRLLHAVLHAGATSEIKLQSFRDIALFDSDEHESLASDPRLRRVHGLIARGLLRVDALLDVNLPSLGWARAVRPTVRERMALRFLDLPGRREHWSGPLGLPIRKWPGYVWPIVHPSSEYRQWYATSGRGRATRAWTSITERRPS